MCTVANKMAQIVLISQKSTLAERVTFYACEVKANGSIFELGLKAKCFGKQINIFCDNKTVKKFN